MEIKPFSPLIIGAMNLGSWSANYHLPEVERFIKECLDLGLYTFDHADIYGDYTTERLFGTVLQADPGLRSKIQIITKCGIKRPCVNRPEFKVKSYDSSAEHIRFSVEQSLRELHTDYIDTLLLHRPDYLMNPEEIARVISDLKDEGKILSFGVSNFNNTQFEMLSSHVDLITNQVEISLMQRSAFDDGVLDQCLKNKIRPMAWSPLAGGRIFSDSEEALRIQEVADSLTEKYKVEKDQLYFSWLMKHPAGIIPITGSSKISRIKSAHGALSLDMDKEDWYALWQAATGKKVP